MQRVLCLTNNPRWAAALPEDRLEFIDGSGFDVFQRARDLVHGGWKFLGHPLYGNFNPAKVPYRTLLLEQSQAVDLESFAMLEKALELFREADARAESREFPDEMMRDYATIDYELMKETIARYMRKKEAVKD